MLYAVKSNIYGCHLYRTINNKKRASKFQRKVKTHLDTHKKQMIGGFSASLQASGRPTKEQIDDEMGARARYEEKKKLKK